MRYLFPLTSFTLQEKRCLFFEAPKPPEDVPADAEKAEDTEDLKDGADLEEAADSRIGKADEDIAAEKEKALAVVLKNLPEMQPLKAGLQKIAEDPETREGMQSVSEKLVAGNFRNPQSVEWIQKYKTDPAAFNPEKNPQGEDVKVFIESLDDGERNALYAMVDLALPSARDYAKSSKGEMIDADIDALKKSVEAVTTSDAFKNSTGKARLIAIGKVMMDHGVVIEDKGTGKDVVIKYPKTVNELVFNKVFGTISYFLAFFADGKKLEEDEEQRQKNDAIKQKGIARGKIEEELKQPGKTVEGLIADRTTKKAALIEKIGKDETGGLKKVLTEKNTELTNSEQKLKTLPDGLEKTALTNSIAQLKTDITKIKKDIAAGEKELAELTVELAILEEKKKGAEAKPGEKEKVDLTKKYEFIKTDNDWIDSLLPDEAGVKYLKTETGKIIRKFQLNMALVKPDGSLGEIAAEQGIPEGDDAKTFRFTLEKGGLKNWVEGGNGYQLTMHDDGGKLVMRARQQTKDESGKIIAMKVTRYVPGKGWGPDTL